MDKKIEAIVSEIEILAFKIEEKKYSYNEEEIKLSLEEDKTIKISDVSCSECQVIGCIADRNKINGIEIAKQLGMTRGGISKIANRLINKNLITTYKDDTNQKKVFYKLTQLGEKVNEIHQQLHLKKITNIQDVAKNYSSEEQDIILRFVKDLQGIV